MAKKARQTKTETQSPATTPPVAIETQTPTAAAPVATAPGPRTVEQKAVKGDNVKSSKSSVDKPTKAVWAIADEMRKANPQATRKEIVDECIRRGVAYYTARTQYQRWSKSRMVRLPESGNQTR